MREWLDSAYPPNTAQVAQAKAAGYDGWAGYFAGTNILNGWTDADFDTVREGGLQTLAYCSGWADPAAMRARGERLGIWICLDDESGIRVHGLWVQPWLDAAQSGLYGNGYVHSGHSARFHVLAAYPTTGDLAGADWSNLYAPRPAGLCGWQWAGSHTFAGRTVDSSWFDDGIAPLTFGPRGGTLGDDMLADERQWLLELHNVYVTRNKPIPAEPPAQSGETMLDRFTRWNGELTSIATAIPANLISRLDTIQASLNTLEGGGIAPADLAQIKSDLAAVKTDVESLLVLLPGH